MSVPAIVKIFKSASSRAEIVELVRAAIQSVDQGGEPGGDMIAGIQLVFEVLVEELEDQIGGAEACNAEAAAKDLRYIRDMARNATKILAPYVIDGDDCD